MPEARPQRGADAKANRNQQADEDILPQALSYAIWAETNPDSIKAIWLESKHRPEDIEIDWDNLDIRVILIAPSFKKDAPQPLPGPRLTACPKPKMRVQWVGLGPALPLRQRPW